jgi:hypothetical protein
MPRINDLKVGAIERSQITNVSLSNYYQVHMTGLSEGSGLMKFLKKYGLKVDWLSNNLGLMCSEATLPTSSLATAEVKDNFHGINEQYAHTRLYTDSDFTFYLDGDYRVLKFFEGWIDYVAGENNYPVNKQGGQVSVAHDGYYKRFNYPLDPIDGYKLDGLYITKGEKDSNERERPIISYRFFHAFPKAITSIPVSYGSAEVLRVTVSFAYDRYIVEQYRGWNKGPFHDYPTNKTGLNIDGDDQVGLPPGVG